jgi:hypothetical protein
MATATQGVLDAVAVGAEEEHDDLGCLLQLH